MHNQTQTKPQTRPGEYPVPTNAKLTHCRTCNAEGWWTTTRNNKPILLSAQTVQTGEDGQRYALAHFSDCPNWKRGPAPAAAPTMTVPEIAPKPASAGQRVETIDVINLAAHLLRHHVHVVATSVRWNEDKQGHSIDGKLTITMTAR